MSSHASGAALDSAHSSDAPAQDAALARSSRWRFWRRALLLNLPFALLLIFGASLPTPLKTLASGLVVLLVPGLGWVDRRTGDAAVVLFRSVLASMGWSLVTWLVIFAVPGPTQREAFLVALALVTNLGSWLGQSRGWFDANPFREPLARSLSVIAALFYLQCYLAAAYFVPPLEDLDMELQATAYGLVNEAVPTMTTNDEAQYYFAHPILLHLLIGESFLVSGDLERVRYYHEGATALGSPPTDEAARQRWGEATAARWEEDFAHFERDPVIATTRAPNVLLSALLIFPLGFLAYRLSGALGAALITCALYATLPEVYVRGSYGGYMAIANFLTTMGAYLYLAASKLLPERGIALPATALAARGSLLAAFLGGWADQKTLLLPLAAVGHAGVRTLATLRPREWFTRRWFTQLRERPDGLMALGVTFAFFAGWGTYVVYGLWVDSAEFIEHHLRLHVADRLAMNDVNLKEVQEGDWVYPSILALWLQFADHTGWLVVLLWLPALVFALKRVSRGEGLLLCWVLAGAVGFSLVDWRQTKHLAQFLPAFCILIGVLWGAVSKRWRYALAVTLCLAITWNCYRILRLVQDFEHLTPLPIW